MVRRAQEADSSPSHFGMKAARGPRLRRPTGTQLLPDARHDRRKPWEEPRRVIRRGERVRLDARSHQWSRIAAGRSDSGASSLADQVGRRRSEGGRSQVSSTMSRACQNSKPRPPLAEVYENPVEASRRRATYVARRRRAGDFDDHQQLSPICTAKGGGCVIPGRTRRTIWIGDAQGAGRSTSPARSGATATMTGRSSTRLARTGAQWAPWPRKFGPKSTAHDRLQNGWSTAAGVGAPAHRVRRRDRPAAIRPPTGPSDGAG